MVSGRVVFHVNISRSARLCTLVLWYFFPVRAVVRKQAILLGLGVGAGIVSATLGSLAQGVFHVSGLWVSTALWGTFFLVFFKIRPDFFR